MTVQNLMSDVEDQNGFGSLGYTLLGILYLFQCLGSIVSAAVVKKLGIRQTIILGGFFLS